MTDREKDRIECAIRHIESSLDVDSWAVEIAVEAMKTQLSAEGTTSDLISRQAAIDAIRASTLKYTGFMEMEMYTDDDAVEAIEDLPSVQPDNRLEKIADLVEGTIDHFDRDDAMDLLYQIKEVFK